MKAIYLLRMKIRNLVATTLVAIVALSCASTTEQTTPASQDRTQGTRTLVSVAEMPASAHPSCSADVAVVGVPNEFEGNGFDGYYELVMDGQVAMRYLFQPSLSQAQIEHVVRTTRWYLTDVPGSKFGADKAAVISTLASNEATMVIPDGSHVEGQELGVRGQELYNNEIAAPGSSWYTNNDDEHRDATLEEVFHQVHDAGIGTNETGALPDYQAALLAEAEIAKDDGRWATGSDDWIADLTQEGSLAQEYIASVIDNYYGLWAHSPSGSGYYAANTRDLVVSDDPAGAALLKQFLGDTMEIEAFVDPEFDGTFTLTTVDDVAYSNKSQYLRGARLTGDKPSGLTGNNLDNTLRGNAGDNVLDGNDGDDTVIYCNESAAYSMTSAADWITVSGPDGTDTLRNIEMLHFADGPRQPPPNS